MDAPTIPDGCCPDANVLGRFVEGHLADAERASLEQHLDGCVSCTLMFRELGVAFSEDVSGHDQDGDDARGAVANVVGSLPDRFTLLYRLGAGGMAEVFAVEDRHLGRTVALKVLTLDGAGPDGAQQGRKRFLQEARVLAGLDHEAILAVHDIIETPQWLGLVLPLVRGHDIRAWIEEQQPSWSRVVEVYRQAAAGLGAAHRAGVVHRDVKPDNILVSDDGRVRVADFGLAWVVPAVNVSSPTVLTQAGTVMGTPGYMAPEQLAGKPAGPAADVFSLSVAIWEGLTGARPFRGASIAEQAAAIAGGVSIPTDGDVPRSVLEVVARGLAAEPSDRWPSMEALEAALRPAAPRSSRAGWVVGLGGVAAVGVGLMVGLVGGAEPSAEVRLASESSARAEAPPTAKQGDPDGAQRAAEPRAAARSDHPTLGVEPVASDRAPAPIVRTGFKAKLDDAGALLTRGDPEGCLRTLEEAYAAGPVPEWVAVDTEITHASCLAAVGQCDEGRQRARRAFLAAGVGADRVDDSADNVDAIYCPLTVPGTPTRRLARLGMQLMQWSGQPERPTCAPMADIGLEIFAAAPSAEPDLRTRAGHMLASCLASLERCDEADAMWAAAVRASDPTRSPRDQALTVASIRKHSACAEEPK